MTATEAIWRLMEFAKSKGLVMPPDVVFVRNALLAAMQIDAPERGDDLDVGFLPQTATPMLDALTDDAVARGLIEDISFYREQFAAHLMSLLTPPPSWVTARFNALRIEAGVEAATNWFYALCRNNDYIRVDHIAKNIAFPATSAYGKLEITINLSKPEKDPREIARQKNIKPTGYPKCMLCVENVGYAGHPGYPSHETLRMIPLSLGGEEWYFQYSPYSYYPEHCIALNARHVPMALSRRSFHLLLDFMSQYPHYFIGSNADLPIVGGSILTHDHFQGGRHIFPMDKASAYAAYIHPDCSDVRIEAVRWPMTCIRMTSGDPRQLVDLSALILDAWRSYDDPAVDVLYETNAPHNTVTPIARRTADGRYVMQLVLRNNRTSDEHPLGIFHPHGDLHHIKRENIGLIEVMGLFILPGRLDSELTALVDFLTGARPLDRPDKDDPLLKHYDWIYDLAEEHGTALTEDEARAVLKAAVGVKCARVLEDAGVFKATPEGDEALRRFLTHCGMALA